MKKRTYAGILVFLSIFLFSCDKVDMFPHFDGKGEQNCKTCLPLAKQFPADIANSWIDMQQKLISTTPGYGPGPAARTFAYSGLALYESLVPGMPEYQSLFKELAGQELSTVKHPDFLWPASANSAMAGILRKIFSTTSAENLAAIDLLEATNNSSFEGLCSTEKIQQSIAFGTRVANAVFEWSKTDGSLVVYPVYVPPTGPGLWIPTPPAFAAPVGVHQGSFRPFSTGLLSKTKVQSPITYSELEGSLFYKMVDEVYQISQHLTADDISLVKTWGDIPGNFNGPSHFTKVLTQLIGNEHLTLEKAAVAYVKHGAALYDAGIAVFAAKYTYNLIRPVSYITGPLGHTGWSTVIPTPPHPEYPAAHATTAAAAAAVLETLFGKNYAFTDHTHDALYGPRNYNSFKDYAKAAGWSRVLGGIHYYPSVQVGLAQGETVGKLINSLPLKKGN